MTHKRTESMYWAKKAIEEPVPFGGRVLTAKIIDYGDTRGNHQYVYYEINGYRAKFFLSGTTSTHAMDKNMMAIARREVLKTAKGENRR